MIFFKKYLLIEADVKENQTNCKNLPSNLTIIFSLAEPFVVSLGSKLAAFG